MSNFYTRTPGKQGQYQPISQKRHRGIVEVYFIPGNRKKIASKRDRSGPWIVPIFSEPHLLGRFPSTKRERKSRRKKPSAKMVLVLCSWSSKACLLQRRGKGQVVLEEKPVATGSTVSTVQRRFNPVLPPSAGPTGTPRRTSGFSGTRISELIRCKPRPLGLGGLSKQRKKSRKNVREGYRH